MKAGEREFILPGKGKFSEESAYKIRDEPGLDKDWKKAVFQNPLSRIKQSQRISNSIQAGLIPCGFSYLYISYVQSFTGRRQISERWFSTCRG